MSRKRKALRELNLQVEEAIDKYMASSPLSEGPRPGISRSSFSTHREDLSDGSGILVVCNANRYESGGDRHDDELTDALTRELAAMLRLRGFRVQETCQKRQPAILSVRR